MKHILKCPKCNSYGLQEICECGHKRIEPKPPKYSPEDKYGKYRREAKKIIAEQEEQSGNEQSGKSE